MSSRLLQILRGIGKTCEASSLTEAEVEKLFQEKDFFLELGYEGFGKDLLAQRGRLRKRFDVALTGFGGRIHAVIEFKRVDAGHLESFRGQLVDSYVRPHLAVWGVLTNGEEMIVYARTNGEFPVQLPCFRLSEATEEHAAKIQSWLHKQSVDLESLDSVLDRLKYHKQNVLLISDPESEQARIFFQVFQLRRESAFGRLALALKEVLPETLEASRFARGSYDFWLKTFDPKLKYDKVPQSWHPFLVSEGTGEIAQLSFILETAYTIITRLMLAKAADDRRFPGVRFIPRLQESLNELAVHGRLTPEKHREVVDRCFKRAGEVLFSTIFLQDIFDWWLECPQTSARQLFFALGESILTVTQFDFSELSGDLLGALYQLYFDRDTRKALGEFYTPAGVIEFILDECGYTGERGDRLLDPACGSGSFLVAALRRYLTKSTGDPKKALLDLTEGLRIVGFDINPFAVLMRQVNYAALILPLYAEAIHDDPNFHLVRLPVFRTDSLRIEEREQEAGGSGTGNLNLQFQEKTLDLSIYLPIQRDKKQYHKVFVSVPRYHDAKSQKLVGNLEDYVAALALLFQAVRDRRQPLTKLLETRFGKRAGKLHDYLESTLRALEETVAELKGKFDDGRFLKTIEDLVLAVSLKHDLQYDFVVGNPPYVRIQKIAEHVKEYWADKYEWTERNYDLYVPFLERTIRSADREGWLGKEGRLGFILSDRFLNVDYGQKTRENLPKTLELDLLFDFRDTRLFEGALNYPAILIGRRRGNDASSGDLKAARVFASDSGFSELVSEFRSLREKKQDCARGSAAEVFSFPRSRLHGEGWWLMPADERAIYDKLSDSEGMPLTELTASASAGFAGYQTSGDSILVFDEVQTRGDMLKVLPRHGGLKCGCGDDPIGIEKGALRPFLFGKDVNRWMIDWKHTWVLFPYERYAKKKTLGGQITEEWNLIPCTSNISEFQFLDPDAIEIFEDRFPKAWKYLRKHEQLLRKRENNRFAETGPEAHLWYGAGRPQNLDYYFCPKLVLQLLSRRNSLALDDEGKFVFQAGGKGGGVYGIVPGDDVSRPAALMAVLNSAVVDFYVKEISSVYGSRFYSYADQFLREFPIMQEILKSKSKIAERLAMAALMLTKCGKRRHEVVTKINMFPESFEEELSRYELMGMDILCRNRPSSAQVAIEPAKITVGRTLYGFEVRSEGRLLFEFEHQPHAECLAEALRARSRRTLSLKEILSWRFPVKPEGAATLLSLVGKARGEIARITIQMAESEELLNEDVYALYDLSATEQEVIKGFLNRYSSRSIAEVGQRNGC